MDGVPAIFLLFSIFSLIILHNWGNIILQRGGSA